MSCPNIPSGHNPALVEFTFEALAGEPALRSRTLSNDDFTGFWLQSLGFFFFKLILFLRIKSGESLFQFFAEKEQGGDSVLRARGQAGDFVPDLKCAEAHLAIVPSWLSCLVGYLA